MRIIAASIDRVASSFLHPGYGASLPRPYGADGEFPPFTDPKLNLDVVEALRLQGEAAAGPGVAPGAVPPQGWQAWLEGSASYSMLLVAATLFGVLALLCFLRSRRWISRRGLQLSSTAAALVLLVLMVARPPPLAAPAESARFARPELATQIIIHGILADALSGRGDDFEHELALPSPSLSPGMLLGLSLASQKKDGWGRPLHIAAASVTSAGSDGKLGTADDLACASCAAKSTDPHAFFLTRDGGQLILLIRRRLNWGPYSSDTGGFDFDFHDPLLARRMTGSVLFDAIAERSVKDCWVDRNCNSADMPDDEIPKKGRTTLARLRKTYQSAAARRPGATPLLLLIP